MAARSSAGERPNFEPAPVEPAHFPAPPRGEFGPQPKVRSDAEFARGLDDALEFAVTVDDDDRPAAQALGQQGGLDVGAILVSVADQQGIRRVE